MEKKLTWRIYYADGSTFEGDPHEAPPWGIIDIMQIDPERGPYHQTGFDYYVFRDNVWLGVDFVGLVDFLIHEVGLVKFGRTINTQRFLEIRAGAGKDFGR